MNWRRGQINETSKVSSSHSRLSLPIIRRFISTPSKHPDPDVTRHRVTAHYVRNVPLYPHAAVHYVRAMICGYGWAHNAMYCTNVDTMKQPGQSQKQRTICVQSTNQTDELQQAFPSTRGNSTTAEFRVFRREPTPQIGGLKTVGISIF